MTKFTIKANIGKKNIPKNSFIEYTANKQLKNYRDEFVKDILSLADIVTDVRLNDYDLEIDIKQANLVWVEIQSLVLLVTDYCKNKTNLYDVKIEDNTANVTFIYDQELYDLY